MKPEQFIRWFGIEDAKYLIEQNINCNDFEFSLDDLKRLVKSVEIINQAGGYEVVKTAISNYRASGDMVTFSSLEKRLKDHESIYGGGDE
ncbi:hypothetical protein J540_3508 [Acinetobacter baumannii 1440422]|nr:hypothetical protein J540_3508 [Acinetobacter baumannii 1440422]